ncbi:IPT/TIG domain-containing protein [uncultured Kordia sp.]|uniref:IPT/TIG domain-containing protein n=1 Tax=uncultured Kordia sp. TaxID=507699 RepID=UPI00260250BC|nr:IPT/TIG domain-containing protein [uncultured Kordia sp.]
MKLTITILSLVAMFSFAEIQQDAIPTTEKTVAIYGSNFSLVNDTKSKISIYTGSGYVTLNKGSKTSISCKVGKTVHWASKGRKGDVIFKITSDMCGETIKLSKVMD